MEASKAITRRVLVIGRNLENRKIIHDALRQWNFEIVGSSSLLESAELLNRQEYSLAFCEPQSEDGAYRDFLSRARRCKVPVVVLSPTSDQQETLQQALALGASDVLPSPCSKQDVQWMVIWATQQRPGAPRTDLSD